MESKAAQVMRVSLLSVSSNPSWFLQFPTEKNILWVNNITILDYDGRKFYIVSVKGTAY